MGSVCGLSKATELEVSCESLLLVMHESFTICCNVSSFGK